MATTIVKCTCKNSTQDILYGIGNRLANQTRSGQWRCTVCGNVSGSVYTTSPTITELAKQQAPSKKEKVKNIKPKMNKDKKFGRK
jgi:hypothetical protein